MIEKCLSLASAAFPRGFSVPVSARLAVEVGLPTRGRQSSLCLQQTRVGDTAGSFMAYVSCTAICCEVKSCS